MSALRPGRSEAKILHVRLTLQGTERCREQNHIALSHRHQPQLQAQTLLSGPLFHAWNFVHRHTREPEHSLVDLETLESVNVLVLGVQHGVQRVVQLLSCFVVHCLLRTARQGRRRIGRLQQPLRRCPTELP